MKLFLTILLLVSSLSALAENCNDLTDTHSIRLCQARELEKQDKRLNIVYGKLLKSLDLIGQSKLRKAQRAWITFRDTECDFIADEMRGGTMEIVLLSGCQVSVTKERADKLQRMLNQ